MNPKSHTLTGQKGRRVYDDALTHSLAGMHNEIMSASRNSLSPDVSRARRVVLRRAPRFIIKVFDMVCAAERQGQSPPLRNLHCALPRCFIVCSYNWS